MSIYIYIKLFILIISLKLYFKIIRESCYNDHVYSLNMDVYWLHHKPFLSTSYSHSATPTSTGCQKHRTILLPQEASQKVVKTGYVALIPSCPSLRNENCNPLYSVLVWSQTKKTPWSSWQTKSALSVMGATWFPL